MPSSEKALEANLDYLQFYATIAIKELGIHHRAPIFKLEKNKVASYAC